MDYRMPNMGGLETAREMFARYPDRDPKIVALTAHVSEADREEGLKAGMCDYLCKPFGLDDLRRALKLK